jgi:hypothetical protein
LEKKPYFTQNTVLVYLGLAAWWFPCDTHVMEFSVSYEQARSIKNKKRV